MSSYSDRVLDKRLMRPLLGSILAAAVIYSVSVFVSDFHAVSESIDKLGLPGWVFVLGLSLVNYGLRFSRWEIYLRRLGIRIPLIQSLAYYLGGFAFTTTPGKAGEAIRSLYLKRHGVAYVHSLAAFFAERFIDLAAMVLLALAAAMTFPDYQWAVLVATGVVLGLLPLIHVRRLHILLDAQSQRLQSGRLRSIASRFVELLSSSSTLLRSAPLYAGIVLAILAWGAEGIAFHFILQKLGVNTSLGLAIGIYSVSVLAGAISFIPGGLGSTEAVMVLLLTLVGADASTAVAATLICRVATLWFAVIIGASALGVIEVNTKIARRPASSV